MTGGVAVPDTMAESRLWKPALDYIQRWTGIALPETKYRGLGEFLDRFDTSADFGVVAAILESDAAERRTFLDAVTINETYFFREQRHFVLLRDGLFEELARGGSGAASTLRVWSAACSTGEEAWSLAMLGASILGPDRVAIYAGDINPAALARCSDARYGPNSRREDGAGFSHLYDAYMVQEGRDLVAGNTIRGMVKFFHLNLAGPSWDGIPEGLDLVFVRNVLMYMPMETRQAIVSRIATRLREGGCLFFSSSELPHLSHPSLLLQERDGVYYFRRKTREEMSRLPVFPVGMTVRQASRDGTGTTVSGGLRGSTTGTASGLTAGSGRHDKPEEGRREAHAKPVRASLVASLATQKLNNPLFDEPELHEYTAALECLEIIGLMGSGKRSPSEALASIAGWEHRHGTNALSRYLTGIAMSLDGETASGREPGAPRESGSGRPSEAAWLASLALEASFWPARLQLAMLIRQTQPARALAEFKTCAEDIEAYVTAGRYEYQCLLEGFNARYFLDLCKGWIRKLSAEGAVHAAG